MKLYTEEQVKIAYSKDNNDGYCGIQRDFIQLNLTTIELPSDEEIKSKSELLFPYAKYNSDSIPSYSIKAFQQGVKWMKEKILNQNK
jgi:hypothetical protein